MQYWYWTFILPCISVLQSVIATDETTYLKTGSDKSLFCPITGTVVNASWEYCDSCKKNTENVINIAIGSDIDKDYRRKDRIAVEYDQTHNIYTLTLLNFNGATDVGVYFCEWLVEDASISSYYYTVQFADGPSTAAITGNDPVFADGSNSLTLTCDTDTATPGVTYEWENGTNVITGETGSTLTLSPAEPSYDGTVITCIATNSAFNEIKATSDQSTLTVHYGPESANITGNVVAYADGYNELTLTCTAYIVNPGVAFDWSKSGTTDDTGNTGTLTFTPTISDNDQKVECIAKNNQYPDRKTTDTVTLTIHYGPTRVTITGNKPVNFDGSNQLRLECTAEQYHPGVVYQWREGNTKLSNSRTYTTTVTPQDNGRNIRCIAWNNVHTNRQVETSETFTVYFGPNVMQITTNTDVLIEGNTVTVTCEASEANPTKDITWYKNNVVMTVDNDYSRTTGTNSGIVTSQTWSKQLTWQDNMAVIKCETRNHMFQVIYSTTQLNVEYGAKDIIIGVPSDVSEGDDVAVICSCHSNPNPTFEITGPTTSVPVTSDILGIRNISRTDAGDYSCKAWNKHSTDTKTVTMVVKYPPDVTVSYTTEGDKEVAFTCQAKGIPQTYNFGSWKHIAPDGETVIREVQGDQNGDQYTLILNSVTYEDSGYYECTVNNGVQGRSTQMNQTKLSEYFVIEEMTEVVSSGVVAGAVVGTLVAVLVIVVITIIVLWRRGMLSNISLPCLRKQKETMHVYENHSFDTVPSSCPTKQETRNVYENYSFDTNPSPCLQKQTEATNVYENAPFETLPLSSVQKKKDKETRNVYEDIFFDTEATNNNDAVYQQLGPNEDSMMNYEVLYQPNGDNDVEYVNTKLN